MEAILVELARTPLPTILVLAGILFLFLAIVGKFGARFVVSPQKQKLSGLLGSFLLIGGLVLYFLRPSPTPVPPAPVPPAPVPPAPQPLKQSPLTKKSNKIVRNDISDMAKMSCEQKYNPHVICDEGPQSCRFYQILDGISCSQYCEKRGGRCLYAYTDANGHCEVERRASCNEPSYDTICECTL